MKKILTIARREYQAMVATKAFLIGLAMMPVLMLGGMYVPSLLKGIQKSEERTIAVIDGTGQLFAPLKLIMDQKNAMTEQFLEAEDTEDSDTQTEEEASEASPEDEKRRAKQSLGMDDINTYVLEEIPADELDDDKRLELSQRIRDGELHGFVEIPADILEKKPLDLENPENSVLLPEIIYCSQDSAISDVKSVIRESMTQIIRARRLEESGLSQMLLLELQMSARVKATGLYDTADDGTVGPERKPDELTSIFLPMGVMMLMFMIVMMSAQPMLESVLEEKSLRISEVLMGSANARQLMFGKLIGNVCGSLTVFALYAGGAIIVAARQGYLEVIPVGVLPYFVVFQILAVLLFSSVFMAIGASVSQLREAQSLLLPVWMVMMLPLMIWIMVVKEPNGSLATMISFFPPSTPLMMTLRLATGAVIPLWQILVSIVLLIACTCLGVIAASRIYRVAILYQGKTPKFSEMASWVIRDPAK